jgi:hypothetical protein
LVSVPGLDKNKLYVLKHAPSGEEVVKLTGKELEEKGFNVKMSEKYDSKIYEIELMSY